MASELKLKQFIKKKRGRRKEEANIWEKAQ